MSLSATYARIRSGIVAFIPKHFKQFRPDDPDCLPYEFIFGTGFIVGDSLVATNAHVLHVADKYWNEEKQEHDVSIISFIPVKQGMATFIHDVKRACVIHRVNCEGIYWGPPSADVGLAAINCRGLSEYALKLTTDIVEEGISIATAGFPMGGELMHLEGRLDHIAPTLQAGIVSAVLPFPSKIPHGYLANIMVQGGASGSPVFIPETGEVIGLIHSQRLEVAEVAPIPELPEEQRHVLVPINFSHVVPTHFLSNMMTTSSEELMISVPDYAPMVRDLIARLPETWDKQISQGHYYVEPRNG